MKAGKESKMTISDLIEKLEKETLKRLEAGERINGRYNNLKTWYEGMDRCRPDKSIVFDEYYDYTYAFISGLEAAYYITAEEADELIEELSHIRHRFWETQDDYLTEAMDETEGRGQ